MRLAGIAAALAVGAYGGMWIGLRIGSRKTTEAWRRELPYFERIWRIAGHREGVDEYLELRDELERGVPRGKSRLWSELERGTP